MIIVPGSQTDDDWGEVRSGIPTASRFSEIITPARGEYSKQSTGYMHELLAARLWGVHDDNYVSQAMIDGTNREDEARRQYEAITGKEVDQVKFVYKDEKKDAGCSPDGFKPGIEIKSPKLKTYMAYRLSGGYPREYKCQIQGECWICDWDYCDFVCYFPGAPLYIYRVGRDDEFIKKLAEAVHKFNTDLNRLVAKHG